MTVIFGVVHDTMYMFSHHVKAAVDKGRKRVIVLEALAGTNWGQQKETIVPAGIQPTSPYVAAPWSTQL